MIKIIEVISDTNIGGAGVLLHSRLSVSDRERFQSRVLVPRGSMLSDRLKKDGISVIEFNGCYDRSFDAKAIFELIGYIKRYRPDILNSHGCLSARIAAVLCRVPVKIYTRHCSYPISKFYNIRIVKVIFSVVNRILSDCVIAVADAVKNELISMGMPKRRIAVVINGAREMSAMSRQECIALRNKLGISENSIVVCISARLERCKGHECFLRAAARILKRGENYHFIIIGSGSQYNRLKALSYSLGIEKNIHFIGFVNDVSPYLNISDIQVNCSIGTETSSLALSEGMSLGLPTVASNYGGNPYMIKNGINGFLYPCEDYRELSRLIMRIANDRELYSSMSKAARERFDSELNIVASTKKTEKLYAELYGAYRGKRI